MATQTLTYSGTLKILTCHCSIKFAVPETLARQALDNGKQIYCPLGHTCLWRETEEDRLRKRLASSERSRDWYEKALGRTQVERDAADRSARAYKGHVTRLRNRIADGICPVDGCRRNFANVKGHIERMHPEWAHEHPEALEP